MKTAVIVHGMPSKEEYDACGGVLDEQNGHWLFWLQEELVKRGISAHVPLMPIPYEPVYEKWKEVLERFEITEETILVGHSCGAGFLVRWLSENKASVGKVALVAPWIDTEKELATGMFDFEINPELANHTRGVYCFYSTDDDRGILASVAILSSTIKNIHIEKFSNKGHFCKEEMGTRAFPELLSVLVL